MINSEFIRNSGDNIQINNDEKMNSKVVMFDSKESNSKEGLRGLL